MKTFARLASVLAILLVAACTTPDHAVSTDTRFDRTSRDAIVVIGIQSVAPDNPNPVDLPLVITWVKTTPGKPGEAVPYFDLNTRKPTAHLADTPGVTWYVMRVPAGTYMVSQIMTDGGLPRHLSKAETAEGMPFFTAQAGEVRYLGDMHWDAVSVPAKIIGLTRNDARVRQILTQYPGITTPPTFRPPAYIPKGSKASQFMTVTQ